MADPWASAGYVPAAAPSPAAIPLRQQIRQQQLSSSQQEMQARGVSMARTGQEMGIAAQKTPAELQELADKHAEFLKKQAAGSQYKLTAGDNELIKKLADQYALSQILAPRSAAFMQMQGSGDSAVPTGPIYSDIPHSPLPNVAVNVSPDRVALGQMGALNQATWALTKPTGAGQIRQFESGDWKTAFPNRANLGTTNQSIDDRNQQEAADLAAKYSLVSQYIQQGKSPAQALADYTAQKKTTKAAKPPVSFKYLGVEPASGGGGSKINSDNADLGAPDSPLDDTGGNSGDDGTE